MRVAVTGGTGFIGSHVVEDLLMDGHEVSCLVLPSEGHGWIEGRKVSFFKGSILDKGSLGPFLEGADVIIHLAGLTRARSEEEFVRVNALGARNIVEAALALANPPRQIIAMSSLAAMGPTPEGGATEEDDLRPISPYGRSKAELERVVGAYGDRIACTFIRAPGVYGPRDKDFLQYFRLVGKGLRLIVGPRTVFSILYVKTLSAAILACLLKAEAYGSSFLIADDGAYNWDEFSGMIEESLGGKTLRIQVPEWMVWIVALGSYLSTPFLSKPPLVNRTKILEARQPFWIVSTAKAKAILGFRPVAPTKAAIAETAAWYKAKAWI